ncbi:hypothetical protein JCM4914_75780 [Streptomyces platensis subsp. malvinus]
MERPGWRVETWRVSLKKLELCPLPAISHRPIGGRAENAYWPMTCADQTDLMPEGAPVLTANHAPLPNLLARARQGIFTSRKVPASTSVQARQVRDHIYLGSTSAMAAAYDVAREPYRAGSAGLVVPRRTPTGCSVRPSRSRQLPAEENAAPGNLKGKALSPESPYV